MRRAPARRHGVYESLVEQTRGTVAAYGHLRGGSNPYRRRLAQLEAGEPVEVPARMLPGGPGAWGLQGWQRVRVWADDRVQAVRGRP